jgi:ribosomal protein S18 acetylase RimI-like enzyme
VNGRPRVRITVEPDASADDRQRVRDNLDVFNVGVTGQSDYGDVSIFLRGPHGEIRGGLLGALWGGWLHVSHLWVAASLRGRGFGQRLLAAAERYAIDRGCHAVWLTTFSFQAPGFYRKQGYERFATIEGYPPGHAHHFLRKHLGRPARASRRRAGRPRPRPRP